MNNLKNVDYDPDPFFDATVSWQDGVQEKDQFVPKLPRPVRRTNSVDDIQRFKDHFLLGQRNMGKWFKWKHYQELLIGDLRGFDTSTVANKALMEDNGTRIREHFGTLESGISHYVTVPEAETDSRFSMEIANGKAVPSTKTVRVSRTSYAAAISIKKEFLLSRQKDLIKKFCVEVRQLSAETNKFFEDVRQLVAEFHKFAQEKSVSNRKDFKSPIPRPSMLCDTNLVGTYSMSLTSLTSSESGESSINPQSTKQLFTFYKKKCYPKRMWPFVRENCR